MYPRNNQNSGGYGRRNYGGGGYRSNGGNYRQQQEPAKRSWAVYSIIKTGKHQGLPIVNAFKRTRQGLIRATVAPYHKTKEVTSKAGKHFLLMMASVTVGDDPRTNLIPCLFCKETRKIVLDSMSMVISPNGSGRLRNGRSVTGYFGKNYK